VKKDNYSGTGFLFDAFHKKSGNCQFLRRVSKQVGSERLVKETVVPWNQLDILKDVCRTHRDYDDARFQEVVQEFFDHGRNVRYLRA
jgi:hypothetical protein